MSNMSDRAWLMREVGKIASALANTFAPLCEVVVHDLTDPEHAVLQIDNNLSGRSRGDSVTELGLARIANPEFPDVIANYANTFSDGRPVKSTSIGLRDKSGNFVAALCLNVDLSYLKSITGYLTEIGRIDIDSTPLNEVIETNASRSIYSKIMAYAAARNREPRSLTSDQKREIVQSLANDGEFERRGSAEKTASILGLSRSGVYYYLRGKMHRQPGTGDSRAEGA